MQRNEVIRNEMSKSEEETESANSGVILSEYTTFPNTNTGHLQWRREQNGKLHWGGGGISKTTK